MQINAMSIAVHDDGLLSVAAIKIDPLWYPEGTTIHAVGQFDSWAEFIEALTEEGEIKYALTIPWFIQAVSRIKIIGKIKLY